MISTRTRNPSFSLIRILTSKHHSNWKIVCSSNKTFIGFHSRKSLNPKNSKNSSFTFPEVLNSFSCSNCKCTSEAKKQLTMKNLPVVCCFHLKRFEQSNRIHKKITDYILFPEILDMKPYLSSTKNKESSQDPSQFDSQK